MYNTMKRLINREYYKTAEEVQGKLDVFFAVGRLTSEQYKELSALVAEVHKEE